MEEDMGYDPLRLRLVLTIGAAISGILLTWMLAWQPTDPTATAATNPAEHDILRVTSQLSAGGWFLPPPSSLQEMIAQSDLIVVGRVEELVHEGWYAGYVRDGNTMRLITGEEKGYHCAAGPCGEIPYLDFQVTTEQVIKGPMVDSFLLRTSSIENTTLEYDRAHRHASWIHTTAIGDHFLYFLQQTPDGQAYSHSPLWGQFVLSGPVVTYTDVAGTPFELEGQPIDAQRLLAHLQHIVQSQAEK